MKSSQKLQKELVCRLTTEEKSEFGRQLADLTQRKERLEDAKKSTASRYKAEIDACQTDINELSGKITLGTELRVVDCEIRFDDPRPGIKTTYRLDTGEVITSSNMTSEDLQGDLFDETASSDAEPPPDNTEIVDAELVDDTPADAAERKALPMSAGAADPANLPRVERNMIKLAAAGIPSFIDDAGGLCIRTPQLVDGKIVSWMTDRYETPRALALAVNQKLSTGWINADSPLLGDLGNRSDSPLNAGDFSVFRATPASGKKKATSIAVWDNKTGKWIIIAPYQGMIDDPESPAGRQWKEIMQNPKALEA